MKTRNIVPSLLVAFSIISTGCATTLRSSFQDQCKTEGWTNDQCDVAFYYGLREKFAKENENSGYDANYNVLTREQALKIFDLRLADLEALLDYKNKDEAKFLKEFGLREYLERQEKIFKADRDRLNLVNNHNNFKQYMGETSSSRPRHLMESFDSASVFVEDVVSAYPFTSAYIDNARSSGNLKEIERHVSFSQRTLGKKEPDPNDPEDQNKFIWRPVKVGVEFVGYKIIDADNPRDNKIDYIEGTRLEVADNGNIKRESKPSLKLFVPGNGYNSVLVIDKDKEGQIGFSLPDFVEQTSRVDSGQSLMNDSVLSKLFYEQESQKRVPPKDPPPVMLEIARVGQTKVDIWETNANGWTAPMKYKNDRADNYSVEVKLKGSEKEDFDHSAAKQMEYFRKTWDSTGKVVEYIYPKPPYNQANLSQVTVYGKDIRLVNIDGEVTEGVITSGTNKFLQDKPHQISYTQAEKRWMIKDEDGDGKYEKKREILEAGEK